MPTERLLGQDEGRKGRGRTDQCELEDLGVLLVDFHSVWALLPVSHAHVAVISPMVSSCIS